MLVSMQKKYLCVLGVLAVVLFFIPAVSANVGVDSPGYIDVSSNPSGALVYIDGTYEGSTPITVTVDSDFSHSVMITYVGYNDYSVSVSPGADEISYVAATLVPVPVPVPSPGYLSISSSPSGARAYIDGSYQGSTPLTVTVSPDPHSVELEYVGYYSWSDIAYAYEGQTTPVYGTLNPVIDPNPPVPSQTGYLSVSSSPSGVSVYVDGSYQGLSPVTATVSTGYHTVRMEKSGYYTWSGSASVASGQTSSAYATLTPVSQPAPTTSVPTYVPNPVSGSGYLTITSDPSGANIYVDNAYLGITPVSQTVSAGSHTVRAEYAGYTSWSDSIFVAADESATVYAGLVPYPEPTSSPAPLMGLLGLFGAALLLGRKQL